VGKRRNESAAAGQARGFIAEVRYRRYTGAMRVTAPLFRLDAGWLFVAAGLAVCAAGVLLPAQGDLRALHQQLEKLRTEESRAYSRLKAYNDFLDQLDEEDPALVRRLAASQLNIVPARDRPVLLSTAQIAPVTNWIEATVTYEPPPMRQLPDSTLGRLANGPFRLWLFAGGIMCVFIGLLMGPGAVRKAGMIFSRSIDEDETPAEPVRLDAAIMEVPESECVETGLIHEPPMDAQTCQAVVEALSAEIDSELIEIADEGDADVTCEDSHDDSGSMRCSTEGLDIEAVITKAVDAIAGGEVAESDEAPENEDGDIDERAR
jgi:hypothetical protein